MKQRQLYYGDNLKVMRKYIKSESVDLCYIDPPFKSDRNYNQIYNRLGDSEGRAQAQAFVDTWTWDDLAREAFEEIGENKHFGRGESPPYCKQTVSLIKGLYDVLGEGSMMAYLASMTQRIAEIHRVLKPTGSFFLHCDPTAGHYLKLITDTIFCAGRGGDFRNEIVWCYHGPGSPGMRQFMRKHDTIFWFSKSGEWTFNADEVRTEHSKKTKQNYKRGLTGSGFKGADHRIHEQGKVPEDWWEMAIAARGREYLGYPTQKPEALLERIVQAASKEGDLVLDAYCGCGTTVVAAERLKRKWIGIDITFHAIAVMLKRLEETFNKEIADSVAKTGIPEDMGGAMDLKNNPDDRLRKDFEKWAILTYTNSYAIPNDKKGADRGIDGRVWFKTDDGDAKMVFQVKSGSVHRNVISTLHSDMQTDGAEMAILITLEEPTAEMKSEAKAKGKYDYGLMGKKYDRVRIVTIKEIIEGRQRLELPLAFDALKKARKRMHSNVIQPELLDFDE